jgi:hypothetical protein
VQNDIPSTIETYCFLKINCAFLQLKIINIIINSKLLNFQTKKDGWTRKSEISSTQCQTCKKKFKTYEICKRHFLTSHQNTIGLCIHCEKEIKITTRYYHQKFCSDNPYAVKKMKLPCVYCKKELMCTSLQRHEAKCRKTNYLKPN